LAGGAKALANGTSSERDVLLNQIKLSIELHGAKRVVFMTHRDCGGYGGSKSFADADAERAAHESQLAAAKALVAGELPDISVDAYFADFDELYKI
jgi:carbonic anhydrase